MVIVERLKAQDSSEVRSRKRLGVMIVAENASLRQGGEAYLAVQWFRELLKQDVDVHLLVHARSRPELSQSLAEHAARIHYVPEVLFQKICWEVGRLLPTRIRDFTSWWIVHLITQLMQRRMARNLIAKYHIDLVHEPTPVAPRLPSMMYDLGVPVIIGPMNGNMTYPPGYRSTRAALEKVFVPLARGLADLANTLIPGKRRADLLLVANERTRAGLPSGCTGKVEILCENAVEPMAWRRPDTLPDRPADKLDLVFLGRLIYWKGAHLAIDVLAQVKQQIPGARLHIIGDGKERVRLEAQARKLGLADAVIFHGWVSHEDCPTLLASSDVLLFPSVFDCGGAVVLEAMALGLSVVALKWGGPTDYLEAGGGLLVETGPRKQVVADMTKAVLSLTPEKRRDMGEAAQRRIAEDFTWPGKVRHILGVYQSVCQAPEVVSGAA